MRALKLRENPNTANDMLLLPHHHPSLMIAVEPATTTTTMMMLKRMTAPPTALAVTMMMMKLMSKGQGPEDAPSNCAANVQWIFEVEQPWSATRKNLEARRFLRCV
jgi:hypothetical protein